MPIRSICLAFFGPASSKSHNLADVSKRDGGRTSRGKGLINAWGINSNLLLVRLIYLIYLIYYCPGRLRENTLKVDVLSSLPMELFRIVTSVNLYQTVLGVQLASSKFIERHSSGMILLTILGIITISYGNPY